MTVTERFVVSLFRSFVPMFATTFTIFTGHFTNFRKLLKLFIIEA